MDRKSWIRPIIALMAMGGLIVGFFMNKIPPDAYLAIASVAITWWFTSRDNDKNPTPPSNTTSKP
ncbi:MAG: hypothetical protein PHS93_08915 [Candidatus Omnitrophica bacterium]|nr:hypothetical protein [Candidatus Omnitrophota bacterium]